MDEPRQLTVGVLAAILGVPIHTVLYFVRTRGLKGSRAGRTRVFSESDLAFLRDEISRCAYRGKVVSL